MDVRATSGADVVRRHLAIDDGASLLGELALVDDASRIQQSGLLFYETLLDESAASHIAWGSGIPDGHQDYDPQHRRPRQPCTSTAQRPTPTSASAGGA